MSKTKLKVSLYSSPDDRIIVSQLYNQLSATDWMDVWMEYDILPGENIDTQFEQSINNADVTLICLSTSAINSAGRVHHILRIALDRADYKPDQAVYIIPIRLEDCDLPVKLKQWQSVDYFGVEKERAYKRIFKSLQKQFQNIEFSTNSKSAETKKKKIEDGTQRVHTAGETSNSTSIGGGMSGQHIIVGDNNIINVTSPPSESQPAIKLPRPNPFPISNDKKRRKKLFITMASILAILLLVFAIQAGNNNYSNSGASGVQNYIDDAESSPASVIEPSRGSTQVSPIDNMTMGYVPAGSFNMGSVANANELPVHFVSVNGFWMDKTEVTNAMYMRCLKASQCGLPSYTTHLDNSGYANHPVIYVSWLNANEYCKYAGRRLPTEAEWEKAARGEDQRVYPWGNGGPSTSLLNYNKNISDTKAVGSYLNGVSPYGILDMAGNVWEWTSSLYKNYEYNETDGREDPNSSEPRVARGGSWNDYSDLVRSANRYGYSPLISLDTLGFRCAQSQ